MFRKVRRMEILTHCPPPKGLYRRRLTPEVRALRPGMSIVGSKEDINAANGFFRRQKPSVPVTTKRLPNGQVQLWVLKMPRNGKVNT